jgi:hypothetical protein
MADILYVRDVCFYPTHLFFFYSRSFVATWAQFFDTGGSFTHKADPENWCLTDNVVNAILFLAPISGFDQALAEVSLRVGYK